MKTQNEKKNKRIAFWITLGVHGGLLLLFMLMIAWREPDPPYPSTGLWWILGPLLPVAGINP